MGKQDTVQASANPRAVMDAQIVATSAGLEVLRLVCLHQLCTSVITDSILTNIMARGYTGRLSQSVPLVMSP